MIIRPGCLYNMQNDEIFSQYIFYPVIVVVVRKIWSCWCWVDSLLSEQQNCKSLLTKCRGSVSLDLCIVAEFSIYSQNIYQHSPVPSKYTVTQICRSRSQRNRSKMRIIKETSNFYHGHGNSNKTHDQITNVFESWCLPLILSFRYLEIMKCVGWNEKTRLKMSFKIEILHFDNPDWHLQYRRIKAVKRTWASPV